MQFSDVALQMKDHIMKESPRPLYFLILSAYQIQFPLKATVFFYILGKRISRTILMNNVTDITYTNICVCLSE